MQKALIQINNLSFFFSHSKKETTENRTAVMQHSEHQDIFTISNAATEP